VHFCVTTPLPQRLKPSRFAVRNLVPSGLRSQNHRK
jgi:hypothetical protein